MRLPTTTRRARPISSARLGVPRANTPQRTDNYYDDEDKQLNDTPAENKEEEKQQPTPEKEENNISVQPKQEEEEKQQPTPEKEENNNSVQPKQEEPHTLQPERKQQNHTCPTAPVPAAVAAGQDPKISWERWMWLQSHVLSLSQVHDDGENLLEEFTDNYDDEELLTRELPFAIRLVRQLGYGLP